LELQIKDQLLMTNSKALYADFEREAVPHMDALFNFALRMTGDFGRVALWPRAWVRNRPMPKRWWRN
jgi:hypothetical protein